MLLNEVEQLNLGERDQVSRSYWAISFRRLLRKKIGVACLSIIVVMYGAGILAPVVTPYDYNDQNLSIAKQGPSITQIGRASCRERV